MALAQVGEPPDVTKTHAEAHTGQQILGLVVPLGPVPRLLLLHLLQLLIAGDPVLQSRVWYLDLHGVPLASLGCRDGLPPSLLLGSQLFAFISVNEYRGAGLLSHTTSPLWTVSVEVLYPYSASLEAGLGYFMVTYGT